MPWTKRMISTATLALFVAVEPGVCFVAGAANPRTARRFEYHHGNIIHDVSSTARCCSWQQNKCCRHRTDRGSLDCRSSPVALRTTGISASKIDNIASAPSITQYTIDVDSHPDVESAAVKHARRDNLAQYLEKHLISTHTVEAYEEAVEFVQAFHSDRAQGGSIDESDGDGDGGVGRQGPAPRRETGTGTISYHNDNDARLSGPENEQEGPSGHLNGQHPVQKLLTSSRRFAYDPQRPRYPVVLDSGCGTGRSSVWLAQQYPHLPVIGVDRSPVRLSKSGSGAWSSRRQWKEENTERNKHRHHAERPRRRRRERGDGVDGGHGSDRVQCLEFQNAHVEAVNDEGRDLSKRSISTRILENRQIQSLERWSDDSGAGNKHREKDGWRKTPPPANLLLLRADLVDFWMLASQDDVWTVIEHFMLYPNPYPKRSQLRRRWHGHPVFPIMLGLGGRIVLRSNWKTYLDEVCQAVLAVHEAGRNQGQQKGGRAKGVGSKDNRKLSLAQEGSQSPPPVAMTVGAGVAADAVAGHDAIEVVSRESIVGTTHNNGESITETEALGSSRAVPKNVQEEAPGGCTTAEESKASRDSLVAIAAVKAAAAYATSARGGPVRYSPTVPMTNFEAKFKAVGETMYELLLEPCSEIEIDDVVTG